MTLYSQPVQRNALPLEIAQQVERGFAAPVLLDGLIFQSIFIIDKQGRRVGLMRGVETIRDKIRSAGAIELRVTERPRTRPSRGSIASLTTSHSITRPWKWPTTPRTRVSRRSLAAGSRQDLASPMREVDVPSGRMASQGKPVIRCKFPYGVGFAVICRAAPGLCRRPFHFIAGDDDGGFPSDCGAHGGRGSQHRSRHHAAIKDAPSSGPRLQRIRGFG